MSVRRRLAGACSAVLVTGGAMGLVVLTAPAASAAVATPTVSSTNPASPNPSTSPLVKGSAPNGSTVILYSNSSCSSSTLGYGSASSFAGSGVTATVPANATTRIYARAYIYSGGWQSSACSSTSVAYTSDSTPPAPVTLTGSTPASPNASTSPAIRGTAEAGSTVRLYSTADCSGTAAATGTAAAFASPGLTVTVAPSSTTTFRATARDAAGNTSGCSTSSLSYSTDATPPAAVTLTGVTPASPNKSTTPTVTGTAEAGSTVRLYTTAGCTGSPAGSGTAAAFASPGIAVTVPANATSTIRATATDAAGNTSACSTSSVSYTNDANPPALVTLTAVTPASPDPVTSPVVSGTAEAGSTVRLYTTTGCTGSPAATGTAAAFASPGLTATVVLGSTTRFRATATDAAGNTSACSTSSIVYTSDLRDGGFEAATGDPPDSPAWVETDSLAWPLCTVATCGTSEGLAPHAGNAWAWFGGFADAGHTGTLSQSMTLPRGTVGLTFWYRNSTVSAPFDAQLFVVVDGTVVRTITEASTPDPAYTQQVVDLAAYADGGTHTLTFSYVNGGEGVNNMMVDDVALRPVTGPQTATPTVTGTAPASPSTSTTPRVVGTAEDGSTVFLYAGPTCTGAPLGSGSAADFAGTGVAVTVPVGSTTRIHARAVKAGRDDSDCSTTFATYTSLGAPDTSFTKTPKKKVLTKHRKEAVVFAFTSPTAGATFQCSVDGKAYKPCTSATKVKLKHGKHTFAVRAVAAGLTDPTPAVWKFRIKARR